MLRSLLIANRGEIAVRVLSSCRRLGIRGVAVYSDADRDALHVRLADAAVRIGPAAAVESYLSSERLIEAAKRSGAEAVHPGYGFLSENAAFAEAVVDAGLIWVGPHPEAMRRMASKIEARKLATELGIPVIPGSDDTADASRWREVAASVGFPLMIKASAGGGGRGIRVVAREALLEDAARDARAEAEAAFGDGQLIFERHIAVPRHIEVQVLGDRHGNCVHLFERECSIQRRHQKVVEEAPAPHLEAAQRESLYAHALTLCRAIDYDSAGTVEFLLDAESGESFFLEMNTRLQVEHPVTECVTGLDLVALQLRSASGEPLPLRQEDLRVDGSAIEVRLNAEDPARDFAPETGVVWAYRPPAEARLDSGVAAGSEVPSHYDSLLAKLIAHGSDREIACGKLERALASTVLAGVTTTLSYLQQLVALPAFREGRLSTRFLEEHAAELAAVPEALPAAVVAGLALSTSSVANTPSPWQSLGRWRLLSEAGHPGTTRWFLETGPTVELVELDGENVRCGGEAYAATARWAAPGELAVTWNGMTAGYAVTREGARIQISGGLSRAEFRVVAAEEVWGRRQAAAGGEAQGVVAPFPGLIAEVRVSPGDRVEEGQVVAVLEAMKMMHNLTVSGAAVVDEVLCEVGASVESGQTLVSFAASDESPDSAT
ncbi:MAG: ATP-grasp domain-containing protein [Myxococcales bacterium]|nr:ATP-grasp domain-containing protein [Myxococcales bacterium]